MKNAAPEMKAWHELSTFGGWFVRTLGGPSTRTYAV